MKKNDTSLFFLLPALAFNDLKERYLTSYLGIMWAFVQPVVTLVIFWFVFSIGFKASPLNEYPFILWLMPGYLAWQYFAEGLSGATSSIVEKSYLVKKILFKVELLPVVKIITALMVHIFFVVVMIIVYWVNGYELMLFNLQLIYYLFAASAFTLALAFISATLAVFSRDTCHVVSILLQIGFWGTPIFWEAGMIPVEYRWLIEINPVGYIVEGYRQSMMSGVWFWERSETAGYWLITIILMIVGRGVFRRMRMHFADVL